MLQINKRKGYVFDKRRKGYISNIKEKGQCFR